MAVRASMADLISRVRRLIADTGASPVWLDQDVQDYLDKRRMEVRYLPLAPLPTCVASAPVQYLEYVAVEADQGMLDPIGILKSAGPLSAFGVLGSVPGPQLGEWESDAKLYTGAYADVTANATADFLSGKWTFTTSQIPPLYLTGRTYDTYAAAADLLEVWAAKVKLEYDFSSNTQKFNRSQQVTALLQLAQTYRGKARVITAVHSRGDMTGF